MLYDDEPPPRPHWPLGLAVAGAVLFLALGVVGLIALVANVGGGKAAPGGSVKAPAGAGTSSSGLPTRKELERRLVGRSATEVLKLMGRPDDTNKAGNSPYWHYRSSGGVCVDPISGQVDRKITVWFTFEGGPVDRITY
jgi:hypothetical protein